jgi:hypothetical protein
MFDKLDRGVELIREALQELDPDVLDGKGAVALVDKFAEGERLCAAGKTLGAKRVSDSGAWRKSGAKSPAHWMANKTGTSVGAAVGVLETAARLTELPGMEKAVRKGQLSEAQATRSPRPRPPIPLPKRNCWESPKPRAWRRCASAVPGSRRLRPKTK